MSYHNHNDKHHVKTKCCNSSKCTSLILESNGSTTKQLIDISTEAYKQIVQSDNTEEVKSYLIKGVEYFQLLFVDIYIDAIKQFSKCKDTKCNICKSLLSALHDITIGLYNQIIVLLLNLIFPIDIEEYYRILVSLYVLEFKLADCEYIPLPLLPIPPFPNNVNIIVKKI